MYGPAFDYRHHELVQANYSVLKQQDGIIPYSDDRLRKAPPNAYMEIFYWEQHQFWEKYNFCPCCNGFTLEIDPVLSVQVG